MIDTDIPAEGITFNDVVEKETDAFQTFTLHNRGDTPSTVSISTSQELSRTIQFQLSNENFQGEDVPLEVNTTIQPDHFNQLYNDIGVINEVQLQPRSSQKIIISFRPYIAVSYLNKTNKTAPNVGEVDKGYESDENQDPVSTEVIVSKYKYRQVKGQLIFSTTDQSETKTIPFMANICPSLFRVDTKEIDFDRCLPGHAYVRDFNLWNCSEMPLSYTISCKGAGDGGSFLSFFDNRTGAPLKAEQSHTIPGNYRISIRIIFKPIEPIESSTTVTIINDKDYVNQSKIKIFYKVSNEISNQVELISCASELHFGDCCTGTLTSQLLTIKNVSEDRLDIHFRSEVPSEISFDIPSEETGSDRESSDSDADDIAVSLQEESMSPSPGKALLKMRHFVKKLHGMSPGLGDVPTRANEKSKSVIDELTIYPGMEKTVKVCYLPLRDRDSDVKAAKLHRRKFSVFLKIEDAEGKTKEKKKIKCTARACTSLVTVSKTEYNLGDCLVGQKLTGVVQLCNLSDLAAEVLVELQSKALMFKQDKLTIPPRQTFDLMYTFIPRNVVTNYRKQVAFINPKTSENEQTIEFKAHIVDESGPTNQSKTYRVLTPHIDFGNVVLNSPMLRTLRVKNTSARELRLKLNSLIGDEMKLYKRGIPPRVFQRFSSTIIKRKEALIKFIEDDTPTSVARTNHHQYLDLANAPKNQEILQKPPLMEDLPAHQASLLLESDIEKILEKLVESFSSPQLPQNTFFTDASQEEQHVTTETARLEALDRAIKYHQLIPATLISMGPDEEAIVYVVFRPNPTKRPSIKTKLRKFDSKITITAVSEFSSQRSESQQETQITTTAKICRSVMDLAQKNINFGDMQIDDHRSRKLLVTNQSEVPLLYKIRKTGLMASLDLRIAKEDRVGVIRPYRCKEVSFVFRPTLHEAYSTQLIMENVHDQTNNQIIRVKANVVRRRNFFIKSLDLDLGMCMISEQTGSQVIVLTNTSNRKRSFTLTADHHSFDSAVPEITFDTEGNATTDKANSIKFTLEAGATQRINAVLIAHECGGEGGARPNVEEGRGVIRAFESNNTDSAIQISYVCSIYHDYDAYKERIRSSLASPVEYPIQRRERGSQSASSSSNETAPIIKLAPSMLELYPKTVDLGDILLQREIFAEFSVVNMSAGKVPYELSLRGNSSDNLLALMKSSAKMNFRGSQEELLVPQLDEGITNTIHFPEKIGVVDAFDRSVVPFKCRPTSAGRNSHVILVRNMNNMLQEPMTVKYNALKPNYIRFPNVEGGIIDMGLCYLDPSQTYVKVTPLHIENIYQEPVYISVQSNLANQVFVFQDKELVKLASEDDSKGGSEGSKDMDILLSSGSATVVYICVQPSAKSDVYNKGQCRNFIGGLRVKVRDVNRSPLDELFVKFNAVVGKSILHVGSAFVDLGSVKRLDEPVTGYFTVYNRTTELPLEFRVVTRENSPVEVVTERGRLDGTEMTNGTSSKEIQFRVKPTTFGLIQDSITV
ncbi:hypothetical protein PROFUN_12152, partial [Planoprotostelium fungivorum]